MFYNPNKEEVLDNLNKSSKELLDYVDMIINRDTVDIDSPEQTDTKTTERREINA